MMKSAKVRTAVTATLAAIVAAAPRLADACAMCGLSPGDHAGHAYNSSVLFMLASPYISFFAIGGVVYFVYRRSARQDRDAASKR